MKAIVYESHTGFTKRYAELLSEKTGLPAYELKEATNLAKDDTVIFMGWICAGSVKGYEKATKRYAVKSLVAVGMGRPCEKTINETIERYHIKDIPVFCLQGGFDMNKLHGVYKIMMKTMAKTVGASLEKKDDKTEEEIAMLQMMQNGGDYVSAEHLAPILAWLEKEPQ